MTRNRDSQLCEAAPACVETHLWECGPLAVLLHACAHASILQDVHRRVGGTNGGQDLADGVTEATLGCLGVESENQGQGGLSYQACTGQTSRPYRTMSFMQGMQVCS